MDSTTAALLEEAEEARLKSGEATFVKIDELVRRLIAELRRVTEPVTDAELAISLRSASVSSSSHVQSLAALVRRLARENAELRLNQSCSMCTESGDDVAESDRQENEARIAGVGTGHIR